MIFFCFGVVFFFKVTSFSNRKSWQNVFSIGTENRYIPFISMFRCEKYLLYVAYSYHFIENEGYRFFDIVLTA